MSRKKIIKQINERIFEKQIGECIKELQSNSDAVNVAGKSFMYFSKACSTIMPITQLPIVHSAN